MLVAHYCTIMTASPSTTRELPNHFSWAGVSCEISSLEHPLIRLHLLLVLCSRIRSFTHYSDIAMGPRFRIKTIRKKE